MTAQETQADIHDSRAVANRFIELAEAEGKTVTIVRLINYVYLAHGWHLGLFHQPLIFHDVEAWKYGPSVAEVFDAFCPEFPKSVRDPVTVVPGHKESFTKDEEMVISETYENYSTMSQGKAWSLTTRPGTPWHQVQGSGYRAIIPDRLIEEYYAGRIRNRHRREEHGKQQDRAE